MVVYLVLMLGLPLLTLFVTGFSLPPDRFWSIATSKLALATYAINISLALGSAVCNGIFGTLVAWVLVRYDFPGKKIVDASIDIPFALPTAVAGVVLTTVYSENGIIGRLFAPGSLLGSLFGAEGWRIAFARPGVFIAMTFVSLPFVIRTLQPVLEDLEKEVEEAAWCLGASPATTFWYVIFPSLIPSILTGVALAFSRAVGEFGSVVIIAANLPFDDMVSSVLIFQRLEQFDYPGATVIGIMMLFLSIFLLLIINLLQNWSTRSAQS
ncbi:MAG: sulfate ABC transporter permease subunit CysT [Pseudanabaenaceae cyanobacterium SKYGB_i_bin29]|nr:sulfate ABC transporter permease subunit CysT [Pseudanabaenaceae cyanobacterium SKYG29]MDW8421429.1 sulfate ABC transporter permease subunit CysT [Pseudanabaenaceae cyanobacterium SKYGB_i_bin29]